MTATLPRKPGRPPGRNHGDPQATATALERYRAAGRRLARAQAQAQRAHDERAAAIEALLEAGMSTRAIADELGVTRTTLYAWRRGGW